MILPSLLSVRAKLAVRFLCLLFYMLLIFATAPDDYRPTDWEAKDLLTYTHLIGTIDRTGDTRPTQLNPFMRGGEEEFQKPNDFRIVGLVFYGRREFVQVLDCYLQRNLVRNGGMLDEIIFVLRTDNKDDTAWLDSILPDRPEYTKHDSKSPDGKFNGAWDVVERGTMYFKIDDEVVFFEDHTIASMIKRKVENPDYLLVAANIVNQPELAWVHYHLNAIHPYLPELQPSEDFELRKFLPASWRASELPRWQDPSNETHHFNRTSPPEWSEWRLNDMWRPPFPGHRWLPLGPGADIAGTPVATVTYSPKSSGYYSWTVGAQLHYSFLQNLENDELWRYKFDVWDYLYEHVSISFMCIWGDDIVDNLPFEGDDDERFLTMTLTQRLSRHAVVDGAGIACDFGLPKQKVGNEVSARASILDTDLLDRYKAYSQQQICPGVGWKS